VHTFFIIFIHLSYPQLQHKLHEKFGGIVPGIAMEAHKRHIAPVIEEALKKAGLSDISSVDGIAVTKGPGLEICLRVGMKEALVTCTFICFMSV
jgi:N6-L-threonylcarbamoyladenine synthase